MLPAGPWAKHVPVSVRRVKPAAHLCTRAIYGPNHIVPKLVFPWDCENVGAVLGQAGRYPAFIAEKAGFAGEFGQPFLRRLNLSFYFSLLSAFFQFCEIGLLT
jgi:hypothetical protein